MAAVVLAFCAISSAYSQSDRQQHAQLSLVSERDSLAPNSSQWIGLRFELEPGWHIYWTNPGDSGEPPKVTWHLPSGIEAGALQFPAPKRISDHGLMDYGYEGQVVLLSKLTVPRSDTSKKAEIGADVRYLVCREVCVPAKQQLRLTLPVEGSAKESPSGGLVQTAKANLPQPLPPGVQVSAVADRDSFVLRVASKDPNFGPVSDFIPAEAQRIENTSLPVIEHSQGATRLRFKKSEQLNQRVPALRGLLIARGKAYDVTIPVTAPKGPRANSSSRKSVFQKTQAPTSNQRRSEL